MPGPGGVSVLFGAPGIGIRANSGSNRALRMPARESARPSARKLPSSCRTAGRFRWPRPGGAAKTGARAAASPRSRGRRVPRNGVSSPVPAKEPAAELAALPAWTGHWRRRARSIGLRCRCDGERGSSPRMHAGHRSGGRALQTIRVRALARNGAAGQMRCPEEFQVAAPRAVRQQRAGAGQLGLQRKAAAPCGRGSRSSSDWGGVSGSRPPPCRRFGSRSRRCRPREQAPPRSCP